MYELMKAKSRSAYNVKVKSDDLRKKTQVIKTDKKTEIKCCFNCGGKNHISATCPSKEKGILCFQCNEHGLRLTVRNAQRKENSKNCNTTQSKVESSPKVIRDQSKRIYKVVEMITK